MMCVAGQCEKRNDGRFFVYIHKDSIYIYGLLIVKGLYIVSELFLFFYLLIYKDLGYS